MVRSCIWILMVLCFFGWATSLVAQGACGKYERIDWKHLVDVDKDCQAKRYCTQMKTCEEARAYLPQCSIQSLDRDGDCVPCEDLCD